MKKLLLIFGAILVLVAWTCGFQVQEGEFAIVSRFGKPARTLQDGGLYFKLPAPIDTVRRLDKRFQLLNPEPGEYLTGDKKNILVDAFLVWRVADPLQFQVSAGSIAGAEGRLSDILRSTVGDVLSSYPFSAMVSHTDQETTLKDVTASITEITADKVRESFGIEVAAARIKRLNFPKQNKEAVFRRMEAERLGTAAQFRTEGEEESAKIKADADRQRATMLAEADRKAQEIRGSADAEATRIYNQVYGSDPELFEFLQSLRMLEGILDTDSTLVLPSDHELLGILQSPPAQKSKPMEQP
ncbi:MAG: protease modulator HflC [Planctomycetota bacterium]|nr:MAG: protease modulator HflC [Planctomycetota bacterium]